MKKSIAILLVGFLLLLFAGACKSNKETDNPFENIPEYANIAPVPALFQPNKSLLNT